ncbi:NAD-dependent epimerase/dehydratase family protein [Agrobacterium tumefaciens]|uniref:NAD-dependent epimerase/dehydratase family protein n=1 Tax=Agrobacterium pusense TaxID=648995 RepID=UPI001573526C|nr:NAD-dependent epimerase/dehydratase family protein [Agrobacterium tumefaciens]
MAKTVLLTGGNGFIGSHVVDGLLKIGCGVRVFARKHERFRRPNPLVDYRLGEFDDLSSLAEALAGVDVVYHLLSSTVPATAAASPIYDVESNLIGALRLITLMKTMNVRRIVFFSSGGTVYGPPEELPINEAHPTRPINSYGIVKVAIENYLLAAARNGELSPLILRLSNPYGPRQGHDGVQGVISTFLSRIYRGLPVEVWGNGSVVRDYIYVSDVASLCQRLVDTNVTGVFNVGSGAGVSIAEILEIVRQVTRDGAEVIYKDGRVLDVERNFLDIAAIKKEFGWEPAYDLRSGIEETWEWIRATQQS